MSSKTQEITVGKAIIDAARANGMTTIFGVPGAQIYPLFDGLYGSGVELIVPRHEQAAGYMAMGYAKSTGRTGVFTVVPGPGRTERRRRALHGHGQLRARRVSHGPGAVFVSRPRPRAPARARGSARHSEDLHQGRVAHRCTGRRRADREPGVSRSSERPTGARGRRDLLGHAGGRRTPRPRGSPKDSSARPEVDRDAIAAAAKLLAAARKPMLMCGAGAQHAAAEVLALAEMLQAPVTAFRSGRGVVPEDHALGVAAVAARELWDDVDVLVGIGSRLEMPYMRWRDMLRNEPRPTRPKLIRIDIDPNELQRFPADVGIVADSATACRALAEQLQRRVTPDANRRAEIAAAKRTAAALIDRIQPQTAYLQAIRAVLPRDGILVPELSQAGFTTYTGAYPVLAPRTYISEGYQGTLGFGFPTALGVKVANPGKAVVSITGDGGFMFGVQELATAAQYRIALVTIVFNNRAYGNVLRDQETQFGGRVIGARLDNPDFVRLAETFGVRGRRVANPAALRHALAEELAAGQPALIEVTIEPGAETSPWSLIHMRARPSQSL